MSVQVLLSNYIRNNPSAVVPMVKDLLPIIGPNMADIIKSNPELMAAVQPMIINQIIETPVFKSFDSALSDDSRAFVQNNLQTVKAFLDSDQGRLFIGLLVEEWRQWLTKPSATPAAP